MAKSKTRDKDSTKKRTIPYRSERAHRPQPFLRLPPQQDTGQQDTGQQQSTPPTAESGGPSQDAPKDTSDK